MEADSPDTAPSREPGHEKTAGSTTEPTAESTAESTAEPTAELRFPGRGGIDGSRREPDDARDDVVEQTDHLHTPHGGGVDWVDADRAADSGPEDPLVGVVEAIERLTQLDPADAASPGTAIADNLSRALEEEEH